MPSLRPVAPVAILVASTMLLACSDGAASGRSGAIVVVTAPGTVSQQHSRVVAMASTATPVEGLAQSEIDLATEPPEAVVALRDADPYRVTDADLSASDNAQDEDLAT